MDSQNVTVSLPKTLLKRAKVFAASTDRSLTQLVRDSLEILLGGQAQYRRACERQRKLLAKGIDMGSNGELTFSREDLHDR